eukprot:13454103-Alexandrium_andersonii.AAC.1
MRSALSAFQAASCAPCPGELLVPTLAHHFQLKAACARKGCTGGAAVPEASARPGNCASASQTTRFASFFSRWLAAARGCSSGCAREIPSEGQQRVQRSN